MLRIARGEPRPGRGKGLVEGAAAGVLGQQHGAAAEVGGEVGRLRPVRGNQEEVHQRLVVAVQVQHHVGVAGEAGEGQTQGMQLAARLLGGQMLDHGPADEGDVRLGVVAQPALQALGDGVEEVRPVAVEIAAAALLVAAHVLAVGELREADGVGVGHQDHLPGDGTAPLGLFEQAVEVVLDQQARRLVGVQGGLQVDLGARAGLPEAVDGQLAGGPRADGHEGQAVAAGGHGGIPIAVVERA